jgi:hypothetical protein
MPTYQIRLRLAFEMTIRRAECQSGTGYGTLILSYFRHFYRI